MKKKQKKNKWKCCGISETADGASKKHEDETSGLKTKKKRLVSNTCKWLKKNMGGRGSMNIDIVKGGGAGWEND